MTNKGGCQPAAAPGIDPPLGNRQHVSRGPFTRVSGIPRQPDAENTRGADREPTPARLRPYGQRPPGIAGQIAGLRAALLPDDGRCSGVLEIIEGQIALRDIAKN